MRKIIKPLTALCCLTMLFASLCACSGEPEKTLPESTSKHEIKEQREAPLPKTDFTDSEPSDSSAPQNTDNSANTENAENTEKTENTGNTETTEKTENTETTEKTENENGVTVTGDPLSPNQLVDFEIDCEWTKNYVDKWYVGEFLDGLDDPVYKDLYCRALALIRLISTDNLKVSSAVDSSARAFLDVFDEQYQRTNRYMESGYTYDSFYGAFCSVFTQETVDSILSRCPFFYSYNGEMWFIGTSAGGNIGEVFQEYELINQTDTELEFKRISYSVDIGEPITDYDPAKKDEYNKTEVNFRFVKTENGWRAAEFLNAADRNKSMLPA